MFAAANASADANDRLYLIGTATPYEWELDRAQALLPSTDNPDVFSGTIYLKGGENNTFKLMENHEWGSVEYGIPTDIASPIVSGEFKLATGTLDNGYKQISVASDGNYLIVVDTKSLEATVTLSDYQDTEIPYCTLYMIGSATPGGWTVSSATPMRQLTATPYVYEATVPLKATDNGQDASFKIGTAIRGAASWDPKYYIFRDPADAGKISTDSTDDRQWNVNEDANYIVSVNTNDNTISINKSTGDPAGIESVTISHDGAEACRYLDLQGRLINNPSGGIFLEVRGTQVRKVFIK